MEERKELLQKLEECKKEINELRTSLNQIDQEKENWFSTREKYSKEISKLIGEVKGSKDERNKFTQEVKLSKGQREEYAKLVREKITEIKKLENERREIEKKFGIKEDPSRIKGEIEHLEMRIETEAMPFEREKEVMKRIKELKKRNKDAEKVSDVWSRMHVLSKEIDELKTRCEEEHRKVQTKAKESQSRHEEVVSVSKEVDELRTKEEEAFKKFIGLKQKFGEVNDKLQEKLIEMAKAREKLEAIGESFKREKMDRLKQKEAEVEEKIKKRQKLTTEDLIALQGMK